MSPENQQPNSGNTNAEIAFVQQALAAADRSERSSRIIVGAARPPRRRRSLSGCTSTCSQPTPSPVSYARYST